MINWVQCLRLNLRYGGISMTFNDGLFKVLCDEKLFSVKEMELPYILYERDNEDFSKYLVFLQEHFREMYDSVLRGLFTAYNKNLKWVIYQETTNTFLRIELNTYEDIHKYIGMPVIEIASHKEKILFGFSFWKDNRMSIEHGFCAIFENNNLLLVSDCDFYNMLSYWDYRDDFNILSEDSPASTGGGRKR